MTSMFSLLLFSTRQQAIIAHSDIDVAREVKSVYYVRIDSEGCRASPVSKNWLNMVLCFAFRLSKAGRSFRSSDRPRSAAPQRGKFPAPGQPKEALKQPQGPEGDPQPIEGPLRSQGPPPGLPDHHLLPAGHSDLCRREETPGQCVCGHQGAAFCHNKRCAPSQGSPFSPFTLRTIAEEC